MSNQPRPLKVLHVISGDLWAGAEVQALTLLSALKKMGGIEIAVALLNDGELARRLRAENIYVSIFDESQLNSLQILIELRQLICRWRPDVVHTHRIKENVLGSVANLLARKTPSLRTAHGAGEHKPQGLRQIPKKALIQLDRLCGNYLQQRIVAVSHELATALEKDFPAPKIAVIENGVDIEGVMASAHPIDFKIREPGAIHVGIIGRLVPVKRVDIFLHMAAILRGKYPDKSWRFHILGDGPLREKLMAQAQKLAIDDICVFHGHRTDIIACMAALNILVMCSDHEGLPMTILEAIVLRVPIVAHAVGGIPNVLKDLDTAALVFSHSAQSYADVLELSLEKTANNPTHTSILEAISAKNNAAKMLNLYKTLC